MGIYFRTYPSFNKSCCGLSESKRFSHSHVIGKKSSSRRRRQKTLMFVVCTITLLYWMDFQRTVTHGFVIHEKGNSDGDSFSKVLLESIEDGNVNDEKTHYFLNEYFSLGAESHDENGVNNAAVDDADGEAHVLVEREISSQKESPILPKEKEVGTSRKKVLPARNLEEQEIDEESERIFLDNFPDSRRAVSHIQIRNTSELHVDNHNDSSQEAGNVKNVPSADYLKKVVVFQKPFHFHIPILSKSSSPPKTTEHSSHPQKAKKNVAPGSTIQINGEKGDITSVTANIGDTLSLISTESAGVSGLDDLSKRGLQPQVKAESVSANSTVKKRSESFQAESDEHHHEEIDLDHLLSQHPKLIPSDSRKRSSKRHEKHHENLEDDNRIPLRDDDEMVGQGDSNVLVSKRNTKTKSFSQDLIDSILGHEDDLVKYKKKIMERSKTLGVTPEEVIHSVVYGSSPNKQDSTMSSTNDIYQRRLKFHQLFLDDSAEVEKYHYNEVVEQDKTSGNKSNSPFNSYMKILKRSKRGLKNWLKKIFKRGEYAKTNAPATTTTTTTHAPKTKGRKKGGKKESKSVYKEEFDSKGDSQVDALLPKALRRSSYLKRREEIKNLQKEEEEFEEEYEKSEEKEPTTREKVDSNEEEEEDEGRNEKKEVKGKKDKRKKKDNDSDEEEEEKVEKKKIKKKKKDSDEEYGKHPRHPPHPSRDKRSILDDIASERRRISILSKDEISLVLEMIFNLIEYQCTSVKRVMDGLLAITQNIVDKFTLSEYIPERRRGVDDLFSQMLDCSSNTENLSKWTHYQMRKRQQKMGAGDDERGLLRKNVKGTGTNLYERPLRRTKRIRREQEFGNAAVELISLNVTSLPEEQKITDATVSTVIAEDEVNEIKTDNNNNGNTDSMKGLTRLYFLVYQIISDTCFNVDNELLRESSLVFIEEMIRLKSNDDFKKEVENFAGHFDISMADKLLTECYEAEL